MNNEVHPTTLTEVWMCSLTIAAAVVTMLMTPRALSPENCKSALNKSSTERQNYELPFAPNKQTGREARVTILKEYTKEG